MKKSLKIKISITIIWLLISALFSGAVAQDSNSGFITFIGTLIASNLPLIIYWLGFWIWGNGYIFHLFKIVKSKVLALILSLITLSISIALVFLISEIYEVVFKNFPAHTIDSIQSISNLFGCIISLIITFKVFKYFSIDSGDGTAQEKTQKFFLLYDPNSAHPWRRYFARITDYILWSMFFFMTLSFLSINSPIENETLAGLIAIGLWHLIEPFFLTSLGTTPGKWMLGIKIQKKEGDKLKLADSFDRSGKVWAKGVFFGLPLLSLITLVKSYNTLVSEGVTSWDKDNEIQVITTKPTLIGIIVLALVWFGFFVLGIIGNYTENNSPHEITLSNIAAEMNKENPQKIDEVTVLNSIQAEQPNSLIYNLKINMDKEDLDLGVLRTSVFKNTHEHWCTNPDTQYFRDKKVKLIYRYTDSHDQSIGDAFFDLSNPAVCN